MFKAIRNIGCLFSRSAVYYYRLSSTNYSCIANKQLQEEVLLVCRRALERRKRIHFMKSEVDLNTVKLVCINY